MLARSNCRGLGMKVLLWIVGIGVGLFALMMIVGTASTSDWSPERKAAYDRIQQCKAPSGASILESKNCSALIENYENTYGVSVR